MLATSDIANVNPSAFKDIITVLVFLLGVAGTIYGIAVKRGTRIEPNPLNVEKVDKAATRAFCEIQHGEVNRRLCAHDQDIRNIYAEMKSNRADSDANSSARSAAVFAKIEDVRVELSEKIDQANALTERGLRDVERAIGRLEGREKT